MNDLYIHQLETENKQLREALHTTRKALEEQQERIDKAIEYINENAHQFIDEYGYIKTDDKIIYADDLLEILGDKE